MTALDRLEKRWKSLKNVNLLNKNTPRLLYYFTSRNYQLGSNSRGALQVGRLAPTRRGTLQQAVSASRGMGLEAQKRLHTSIYISWEDITPHRETSCQLLIYYIPYNSRESRDETETVSRMLYSLLYLHFVFVHNSVNCVGEAVDAMRCRCARFENRQSTVRLQLRRFYSKHTIAKYLTTHDHRATDKTTKVSH